MQIQFEVMVSPPQAVDAEPFVDDGLPETLDSEEEGSWISGRISASSVAKADWTRGLSDIR